MPTQGFQLSQFERAPQIPGNIGVVDTKSIYDSVTNALKTYETARIAQQAQGATDAQLGLATQKAVSEMPLVGPEAEARLSQAQFLASPEYARTRQILSGAQAQNVQEEAAVKQQERARKTRLLTQASLQEDEARQAIHNALEYSDPKTRADELTKIRAQYPWLDTPEYQSLSKSIDYHHKSAMDEAEREANRENARQLAEIRAQSLVAATKEKKGSPAMQALQEVRDAREALDENPDDPALQQRYTNALGVLNALSATAPKDQTAAIQQKIVEKANAAKNQIAALENKNAGVFADLAELENLSREGTLGKWQNPLLSFFGAGVAPKTARLNSLMDTVRARELLDSLAQLKQQGGTLGQVTEKEGQQLTEAIAKLTADMDEASFRSQLAKIRVARENFLNALKTAYESDFLSGRRTAAPLPSGMSVPTVQGGESLEDRLKRY